MTRITGKAATFPALGRVLIGHLAMTRIGKMSGPAYDGICLIKWFIDGLGWRRSRIQSAPASFQVR